MGHTVPIRCPKCSAIQDIELKEIVIDENGAVSLTVSCGCGFCQPYEQVSPDEISALVADVSESPRVADFLGISRESYESYIWPPDVRRTIDQQRRVLPNSEVKRSLRAAALELPKKHDDRWWLVYGVSPPIMFDPTMNEYAFLLADGNIKIVGSIEAVVNALAADL